MHYDLMLLADPGPAREELLRELNEAPDIRPDPALSTRFWLTTAGGEAQINIGTKDPVESLHLEFQVGDTALMEAVALRALELAQRFDMQVEDVQWGHEVTPANLPQLREYWTSLCTKRTGAESSAMRQRPWWRLW